MIVNIYHRYHPASSFLTRGWRWARAWIPVHRRGFVDGVLKDLPGLAVWVSATNSHADSANEYLLEDFSRQQLIWSLPISTWSWCFARLGLLRIAGWLIMPSRIDLIVETSLPQMQSVDKYRKSHLSKEAAKSLLFWTSWAWFVTAPPLPETMRLASLTISFMSACTDTRWYNSIGFKTVRSQLKNCNWICRRIRKLIVDASLLHSKNKSNSGEWSSCENYDVGQGFPTATRKGTAEAKRSSLLSIILQQLATSEQFAAHLWTPNHPLVMWICFNFEYSFSTLQIEN